MHDQIPPHDELADLIDRLGSEQRRKLLAFAKSLDSTDTVGESPAGLLSHVGLIPSDALNEMRAAIEAGCETIDAHAW